MFRVPFTLWRSIVRDLARLTILASGVLVAVIAFAGAVKPLSDGVLAASDAIKYILLGVPPMLAYALPFAGGFAATLVYHRMVTDLETVAAYSGGVSHRRLLAPAALVALACGGLVVGLNQQVIPRFLEQMQRMITMDVGRFIAYRVERGEPVTFRGLMLHADAARRVRPEPGSGVLDQLLLTNFAAVMHTSGVPTREVTARQAMVWLVPDDSDGQGETATRVLMRLEDAAGTLPDKSLFSAREIRDLTWSVPNAFRDNVKFLTWGEINRLRERPETMNWVDYWRRNLAFTLAERRTMELMTQAAGDRRSVALTDARSGSVIVRTSQLVFDGSRWVFLPLVPSTPVEVVLSSPGEAPSSLVADRVSVINDPSREGGGGLLFQMVLEGARDVAAGSPPIPSVSLPGLTYAESPAPAYLAMKPAGLVGAAAAWIDRPEPDPLVQRAVEELNARLRRLDRDILAKKHERFALAAACSIMILAGAVSSLWLGRKQPLAVYAWTFFPALACLVTISGGQQVIVSQGPAGLALMWGGVAGLGLCTLFMYLRVRRH